MACCETAALEKEQFNLPRAPSSERGSEMRRSMMEIPIAPLRSTGDPERIHHLSCQLCYWSQRRPSSLRTSPRSSQTRRSAQLSHKGIPEQCLLRHTETKGKASQLDATPPASVQDDHDEVAILNRTHPLFGRTFRVHHRVHRPGQEPTVVVFFAPEILIRIPVSALSEAQEPPTKLTLTSMTELVVTFGVATHSCPPKKVPSSRPSQTL